MAEFLEDDAALTNTLLDAGISQQVPVTTEDPEDPKKKTKAQTFLELNNYFLQKESQSKVAKNPDLYNSITTPGEFSKRYTGEEFGYNPVRDNENFYAERQEWYTEIPKAAGKFAGYVLTKTGTSIGFTLGLLNPTSWFNEDGVIAGASDNALSEMFTGLEETIKQDWAPTFQETEDQGKGFFARAFTDLNFWTEDVVDGAAFMASAFIPGMALSKLGTGAGLVRLFSGLRLGTTAAGDIVKGLEVTQNYLTNAQRIAKGFDTAVTWATATAGEAMFEAKDVRDKVLLSLDNQINPNTGAVYTDKEKKEIAGGAAKNTFLMNAALLGITNAVQMRYLYKVLGKTAPEANRITQSALGSTFVGATPSNTLERFLASKAGKFAQGFAAGTVSEGYVEENTQLAIQRLNEDYGSKGKVMSLSDYSDVFKQSLKQIQDATAGEDTEASTSIGLGALLGGVMGGAGDVRQAGRERLTTETAIANLNQAQTTWLKFGDIFKTEEVVIKNEKGEDVVTTQTVKDEQGQPVQDDAKLAAVISGFKGNMDQQAAIDYAKDPVQVQFLKDQAFSDFVQAHINAGIEDTLSEKLDSAQTSTPQALASMGFDPTSGTTGEVASLKSLAETLIKQNNLIKNSILQTGSAEQENARLAVLVDLATKQTLVTRAAENITKIAENIKAGMISFNIGSPSDMLVDQLNDLQYKILLQENTLKELQAIDGTKSFQIKAAESNLKELEAKKAGLLKSSEMAMENLKPNNQGLYSYENAERNQSPTNAAYQQAIQERAAYQNVARVNGLQFAELADAKNGMKNFLDYVNQEIVEPVNTAKDASEANNVSELGQAITITMDDGTGPIEQEIQVGKEYITTASEENVIFKGRVTKTFNNNLIKVLAIDENGITIQVNGSKTYIVPLDRFAKAGKLYDLSTMTPEQRIYFKNRDVVINMNVSAKYGKLHNIKGEHGTKDYTRSGTNVKARLVLEKLDGGGYALKLEYINPVTKAKVQVPYSRAYLQKYGDGKINLRTLPGEEEYTEQQAAERNARNLNIQLQIFNQELADAQVRLDATIANRETNQTNYDNLRDQLIDDRAELELVTEELEKYANKKGRRSKVHNDLIKLKGAVATRIQEAQDQIDNLKAERANLESLISDLNKAKDLYEQALIELDIEQIPYDRQGKSTLAAPVEEGYNQLAQDQVTKRLSAERVDELIADTQFEIEDLTNKINNLTNYTNVLKDVLKKNGIIADFMDFQDLPASVGTRKTFRDYLAKKIAEETDTKRKSDWQNLYRQVQKGSSMSGDVNFSDTLFLIQGLRDSIAELEKSEQNLIEAEEKQERLKLAKYQKGTLSTLQDRIDYLNQIQDILTQGAANLRPVVVTPVAVDNKLKDQDELISDTEIDTDPYSPTFGNEKLPKFEEVGFNKTFGRQYSDDNDQEAITEDGADRFFQFTATQNVANQGYELQVVTANNDTFGIRRPEFNPNDIKLVLVRRTTNIEDSEEVKRVSDKLDVIKQNFIDRGLSEKEAEENAINSISDVERQVLLDSYHQERKGSNGIEYIGVDGKVLENPTKDNLVYTSMADISKWTPERVRASYSVATSTTDEQIQSIIDEHKAYQQTLLDSAEVKFVKASTTSPGLQRVETLVSSSGDGTRDIAKAPMSGRIIEDNPDFTDLRSANNPDVNIELRVSTANGAIAPGLLPGRLVMQEFTYDNGNKLHGDKITRVFNRPLEDTEKENIIDVLKRMTELFGRKSTTDVNLKLSEAEEAELDLIYAYLRGIIAWGKAPDGNTSSTFFNIQNGLNRGTLNIAFTEQAIEANKERLMDGVFHYVNNGLLKENSEFTTVKIVDGRVVPDTRYDSYQEYLLSEKDGQLPPVYTSSPRVDSGIPQRTQSYINWTDINSPASTIPVEREINEKEQPSNTKAPEAVPTNTLIDQMEAFLNYEQKSIVIGNFRLAYINKDGGVALRITNKEGKERTSPVFPNVQAILDARKEIVQNIQTATGYNATANKGLKSLGKGMSVVTVEKPVAPVPTGGLAGLRALANKPEPENKPVDINNPAVAKVLSENTTETPIKETVEEPSTAQTSSTGEVIYTDIEEAVNNAKPKLGYLSATVYHNDLNTGDLVVYSQASVKIEDGNLKQAQRSLRTALINGAPSDESAFREVTSEEVEQLEDFKALETFMSNNLPQVPVNKVSELIAGKAWGQFLKGAIYIYENAEVGTGFHEAFEAVWASYLTPQDQENLKKEFRSRKGEFTNPFTRETKPYSEANDYDVREMLAEEFRDHVLAEGNSLPKNSKIAQFFKDLWNSIKSLLGLNPNTRAELNDNINRVFKKIGTGGFRNVKSISEKNEGPVYRIAEMNLEESNATIEGLTYHFFTGLFEDGKSIDTIINELTPTESIKFVNNLYEKAFTKVLDKVIPVSKRLSTIIEANKAELFEQLKTVLERYGLNFDEEVLNKEETTTDTLGIRDTITVNPQKMSGINVKLLIAALPNSRYNRTTGKVETIPNFLRQPSLVDYDRIHNTLLNELANIVPYTEADGTRRDALDLMFEKLDGKYRMYTGNYRPGYLWVRSLKLRLRYEDANGVRVPLTDLTSDDIRLRVSFVKSFTNNKTVPEKTIIGAEGYMYNLNPVDNLNKERVKREWNNDIIENYNNKKYNTITVNPAGIKVFNKDGSDYKFLMDTLNKKSSLDLDKALQALERIGITFTSGKQQLNKFESVIRENTIQILTLMQSGVISTVADLFGTSKVNGRIDTFLELESRFTAEDNNLSYLNSNGQSQYSVGIPSLFGQMINIINSVSSLKALVQTAPWLGNIDSSGEAVLYGYSANSELLRKGGPLFNNKGNRREGTNLSYHVISGLGTSDFEGKSNDVLEYPERVANEIHYLLRNIVYTNINSDKSTEFGIGIPGKPFATVPAVQDLLYYDSTSGIVNTYINQLTDEMYTALADTKNPSNVQYYRDQVRKLGHFRDIMGKEFIEKFTKDVLDNKQSSPVAHLEFIRTNRADIENTILAYIKEQTNKTYKMLMDLDLFEKVTSDLYFTDAIDNEYLREFLKTPESQTLSRTIDGEVHKRQAFTDSNIRTLAGFLTVNKEILLTEQHKLIYGHPVFYKDLPKRANGATSTKEQMVEDREIIQWMDNKMPRNDGKVRGDEKDQTFKTISFKDSIVVSQELDNIAENIYKSLIGSDTKAKVEEYVGATFDEKGKVISYIVDKKGQHTGVVAPYAELQEADAQAWGMPDIIRDMLFLTGKLTKEQEAQFDYEMAYETKVLSERGTVYPKQVLENAERVLAKGNPGYIFQVLKPQYFGYNENSAMMHPTFLKNSVQPKFFRHVEGTQFEELYLAAKKDKVDVIGFESGEKVGNVEKPEGGFVSLYDGQGRINLNRAGGGLSLPKGLAQQKLYNKFWGIQVEMSSKAKETVVRGTQVTKLIMVNSYENGAPIDPKIGKIIDEYNNTLVLMMQNSKKDLIKELGLKKTINGYETEDVKELVKLLRKEAIKRELPDNMIDGINYVVNEDGSESLKYHFDTLNNSNKIDNILNSIVDSRVISEKIHGKASVQVASTLYESSPRDYIYLKDGKYTKLTKSAIAKLTDAEKKSITMQSSDLKFYTNTNGVTTKMEVYIAFPFKGISPEELGLKLVNGIYSTEGLDTRLLESLGFRIPTQAMNSVENIIIKGFTPPNNGDMIVVPSEIVGKSGSDFDIDKMNLYLANYYQDSTSGKLIYVDYKGSIEKTRAFYEDLYDKGELLSKQDKATIDKFARDVKKLYTEDLDKSAVGLLKVTDKLEDKLASNLTNLFLDVDMNEGFFQEILSEEGKKEKVVNQMVKKALQNHLMNSMKQILEVNSNYVQLVTPNSVKVIKDLATEITGYKLSAGTKTIQDEKSYNYLRTFIGSSELRERYLTAKRMVGIAALHGTFHSMAQVAGIKLNGSFRLKGLKYLANGQEQIRTITIKLRNTSEQADGTYAIGQKLDAKGDTISDSGSQKLSGFVDGAKDPFVFDLNMNMNTASTWYYLDHHGVPQEDIAYFFNQPILDQYFTLQSKNKAGFKKINGNSVFPEQLFYEAINPYYKKLTGIDIIAELKELEDIKAANPKINIFPRTKKIKDALKQFLVNNNQKFEKFSNSQLKQGIKDGYNADPELQLAVLYNYLELAVQGRFLSNYIQAIGYDNSKTKSIQENQMQVSKWERSKRDNFIANPNAILEKTFIGEMKTQKEDVFGMFKNFFITLSPKVQNVFKPIEDMIANSDYFASKNDMSVLLQRYQSFVLGYILHTTPYKEGETETTINQNYESLLFGNKSFARLLQTIKNSNDPEITNNLVVRELLPLLSEDENKTDNISLFRNRLDTFAINKLTESLQELTKFAIDTANNDLIDFISKLTTFSLVQSGLQSSSINFSTILPTDLYSEQIKDIISNFIESGVELDVDDVWYNFHANQWQNTTVAPRAPYWNKYKDGKMKVSETSSTVANEFLTKIVKRPGLTSNQVTSLIKEKRFTEAFDTLLLRRGELIDGKYIYYSVNKKGAGPRFLEISPVGEASIMSTNGDTGEVARVEASGWRSYNDIMGIQNTENTNGSEDIPPSDAYDIAPGELLQDYSQTTGESMNEVDNVLKDKDQNCKE